ncbi:DUF3530 family protein [Glaciecola sp. 1036]|uniref:DUF3530 family protein n=1 Tax=Alteromonadaceae TaxID=72275 RepID=UPI003CFFDED8
MNTFFNKFTQIIMRIAFIALFAHVNLALAQDETAFTPLSTIQNDLITQLPPDSVIEFEYNNQPHKFYSLASELPKVRGLFLIVEHEMQFSSNSQFSFSLASQMSQIGWNTIVTFVPNKSPAESEENSDNSTDEQSTEQDSSQTNPTDQDDLPNSYASTTSAKEILPTLTSEFLQTCANDTAQFLNTVITTVNASNQRVVLFSSGITSHCLMSGDLSKYKGVVALSPFAPNQEQNNKVPELFGKANVPVLDLTNDYESHWARATAHKRLVNAKINLKPHYRQRKIIGQPLSNLQLTYLTKEISGWLSYLGM